LGLEVEAKGLGLVGMGEVKRVQRVPATEEVQAQVVEEEPKVQEAQQVLAIT
jgi:hypothetical protein